MKQQTFVLFKDPRVDKVSRIDWSRYANSGESLATMSVQTPYPATPTPLVASITGDLVTLSGGMDTVSYGADVEITFDSGRVVYILLAVTVAQPSLVPTTNTEPTSFADLVDKITAGSAAVGVGVFAFEPGFDPSNGLVEWRLIDNEGTILNGGNAFNYRIHSTGLSNMVKAQCLINVPSNVVPSNYDEKYQIQYILYLNGNPVQTVAENVTVLGLTNTPTGCSDAVEIQGSMAQLMLVTDALYEHVQFELQADNTTIGAAVKITDFERVASGYAWTTYIDTNVLPVSLLPYVTLWSYWNADRPSTHEYAKLFIVNTSILDAINDVQARVNKARTTLYGGPEMLFPPETVLIWLRRGADYFNGATGQFTNFTFTNAKSIIREYWLQASEMFALESQELAEAEKAFNYQGSNISLDVDRSAGYGAAADKIRGRLDQDLKPVKTNLIQKGITGGDGNADPTQLRAGAIGAVGITITPASMWGRFPTKFTRLR